MKTEEYLNWFQCHVENTLKFVENDNIFSNSPGTFPKMLYELQGTIR